MSAIRVFDNRYAGDLNYSFPVLDVLDDAGTTAPVLPSAPNVLSAVESGGNGEIEWEAVTGADDYVVEKQSGTLWVTVLTTEETSVSSAELVVGEFYRVKARNSAGTSLPSATVTLEEEA